MIIHIPHNSTRFPVGWEDFAKTNADEINKMTDWYTNELFLAPRAINATRIVFPFSRLFCDVERFIDDEMEKVGMGICYTKKSDGSVLRDVSNKERELIIKNWYLPHHKALKNAVEMKINEKGKATIIDGHSFSETPLPYEKDKNRPDICVGVNENTPRGLSYLAQTIFQNAGYVTAINSPFSGAIVPLEYIGNNKVNSVMIEINKGIYLKDGKIKPFEYNLLKNTIDRFLLIADHEF